MRAKSKYETARHPIDYRDSRLAEGTVGAETEMKS